MKINPHTESIRKLFTRGQPITYAKGSIILGNEPEPDGVYYLHSGYVKVYSLSDEGDEFLHIIYGSGELFPLPWAYLGTQPDALFYETLGVTTVWRISREWFLAYAQQDRDISYALSVQLAQQFRIFSDRVDNLEYKKASERVAYRLLFLASRFGVRHGSTITIEAPITHELMANSINLARESVSRELEKLEHEHIVYRNSRHNLVILDVQNLAGRLSRPSDFTSWNLLPAAPTPRPAVPTGPLAAV